MGHCEQEEVPRVSCTADRRNHRMSVAHLHTCHLVHAGHSRGSVGYQGNCRPGDSSPGDHSGTCCGTYPLEDLHILVLWGEGIPGNFQGP